MRVAVTGGTGFIGRPLVRRLAEAGHEVLVLTRRPDSPGSWLPSGARALGFDADLGASPGLLDTCEAVIHLAGEPVARRLTEAHKARVLNSRVRGTRAIAQAWSGRGITCNALGPGFFPTALTAPVFEDPGLAALHAGRTAIGRNGKLEDLHGAAVFLASPAAGYITGQTLMVDGGYTAL